MSQLSSPSSPTVQQPERQAPTSVDPSLPVTADVTAATGLPTQEPQKLPSHTDSDISKPTGPKSPGSDMRDNTGPIPRRSTSQPGALSRTPSDPRSSGNFSQNPPANYPSGDWGTTHPNVPRPQPRYPTDHAPQATGGYRSYAHRSGSSYNGGERRNYQSGPRQGEMLSSTNLYIKGLTPDTTEGDLIIMCDKYGKIVSTKAIIDPETNQCKGYGFVDFERAGDAIAAVRALTDAGIQAQMAKQQEQDFTNLYIANLPEYVDENYLESMVKPYGEVVSVRILRDLSTNLSRGVGFCRMQNQDMCQQIINELNRKSLPNSKEPMLIKFADTNRKRTPRFLHANRMHMGGDNNMAMRYNIPSNMGGPSPYLPANMGNWAMYPPITLSPHSALTTSHASNMDPSMLASQLSHLQLGGGIASYPGAQQPTAYPSAAAALYSNQLPPQAQYGAYEMSNTPPTHLMSSQYDDSAYQGSYNPM